MHFISASRMCSSFLLLHSFFKCSSEMVAFYYRLLFLSLLCFFLPQTQSLTCSCRGNGTLCFTNKTCTTKMGTCKAQLTSRGERWWCEERNQPDTEKYRIKHGKLIEATMTCRQDLCNHNPFSSALNTAWPIFPANKTGKMQCWCNDHKCSPLTSTSKDAGKCFTSSFCYWLEFFPGGAQFGCGMESNETGFDLEINIGQRKEFKCLDNLCNTKANFTHWQKTLEKDTQATTAKSVLSTTTGSRMPSTSSEITTETVMNPTSQSTEAPATSTSSERPSTLQKSSVPETSSKTMEPYNVPETQMTADTSSSLRKTSSEGSTATSTSSPQGPSTPQKSSVPETSSKTGTPYISETHFVREMSSKQAPPTSTSPQRPSTTRESSQDETPLKTETHLVTETSQELDRSSSVGKTSTYETPWIPGGQLVTATLEKDTQTTTAESLLSITGSRMTCTSSEITTETMRPTPESTGPLSPASTSSETPSTHQKPSIPEMFLKTAEPYNISETQITDDMSSSLGKTSSEQGPTPTSRSSYQRPSAPQKSSVPETAWISGSQLLTATSTATVGKSLANGTSSKTGMRSLVSETQLGTRESSPLHGTSSKPVTQHISETHLVRDTSSGEPDKSSSLSKTSSKQPAVTSTSAQRPSTTQESSQDETPLETETHLVTETSQELDRSSSVGKTSTYEAPWISGGQFVTATSTATGLLATEIKFMEIRKSSPVHGTPSKSARPLVNGTKVGNQTSPGSSHMESTPTPHLPTAINTLERHLPTTTTRKTTIQVHVYHTTSTTSTESAPGNKKKSYVAWELWFCIVLLILIPPCALVVWCLWMVQEDRKNTRKRCDNGVKYVKGYYYFIGDKQRQPNIPKSTKTGPDVQPSSTATMHEPKRKIGREVPIIEEVEISSDSSSSNSETLSTPSDSPSPRSSLTEESTVETSPRAESIQIPSSIENTPTISEASLTGTTSQSKLCRAAFEETSDL